MELKRTALYELHKQKNAFIRSFGGYEMPTHYGSIAREHRCVREKAGLFDVSHMSKFMIEGPDAFSFLQYVTTNDVSKLSAGDAQYTCLPNKKGGIVDDAVLYRLGKERYFLIANASNREKNWNWLTSHHEAHHNCKLRDKSDRYSVLALQGPCSADILSQITDMDLKAIPFYSFGMDTVADIENVVVSATGYTGSGGYELYVQSEHVARLWSELLRVGASYGLEPAGLGARDTLRLEMGYCLYGQDIDETTSPIEAGLSWITKFNKSFISSEYLQRQKLQGPPKVLVCMLVEEKKGVIPRAACSILDQRELKVGEVTSGNLSISLQRGIAMGYVSKDYRHPGTQLYVEIRGNNYGAEVVKPPFWKKN